MPRSTAKPAATAEARQRFQQCRARRPAPGLRVVIGPAHPDSGHGPCFRCLPSASILAFMLYMVECGFRDQVARGGLVRMVQWAETGLAAGPARFRGLAAFPGGGRRAGALARGAYRAGRRSSSTGRAIAARGGGGFGEWQADITDWSRNLFDGRDTIPEVPGGAFLVTVDSADGPAECAGFDARLAPGRRARPHCSLARLGHRRQARPAARRARLAPRHAAPYRQLSRQQQGKTDG